MRINIVRAIKEHFSKNAANDIDYRKSVEEAIEKGESSVTIYLDENRGVINEVPLAREEALRIAIDEINDTLTEFDKDRVSDIQVVLIVPTERNISSDIDNYIHTYFSEPKPSLPSYDFSLDDFSSKDFPSYDFASMGATFSASYAAPMEAPGDDYGDDEVEGSLPTKEKKGIFGSKLSFGRKAKASKREDIYGSSIHMAMPEEDSVEGFIPEESFDLELESKLAERMSHMSDTFSQYLMYLIQEKQMENAEVYKRAIVDKKVFSKIKNNVDYHPQKMTALCLCVGAKLNLDESKDLLARAGYALSPCDKTDIIFSYFIENEIYDMIELDIQLEEHGLPCIIS